MVPRTKKNVATNATAVYTAMRLYRATQEPSYKEDATEILSWLRANFFNDGHVLDHVNGQGAGTYVQWDWTYNNGGYAGACLEMYPAPHGAQLLARGSSRGSMGRQEHDREGVFLNEGTGDSGGFKAILTRNMWAW